MFPCSNKHLFSRAKRPDLVTTGFCHPHLALSNCYLRPLFIHCHREFGTPYTNDSLRRFNREGVTGWLRWHPVMYRSPVDVYPLCILLKRSQMDGATSKHFDLMIIITKEESLCILRHDQRCTLQESIANLYLHFMTI